MTALLIAVCTAMLICSMLALRRANDLVKRANAALTEAVEARKQARAYFARAFETKLDTMAIIRRCRDEIAARG